MAEIGEVIDSQIIAENIRFLDVCFDNSFTLQSSLVAVKEYIAESENEKHLHKEILSQTSKNVNTSSMQNRTLALEVTASIINELPAKLPENKVVINSNLKDWGLPKEIARQYETRGIKEMFDWQVQCLGNPKVLMNCRNLVYSAPTSAGKTLVAEIITIKTVLERQKKVIVILPFVSIVREKMFYLQDILSSSGIRVEGFMGSQSPPGGLQAVHVAICTIEKANSLVNKLLDEGNIAELGAVIVDELHLLGDPHRGYILELLLTKINYVQEKFDNVQIQIVGMSATLPNLEVLANWLGAELFITHFRPIPLDEYCLVGNKIYDKQGLIVKNLVDDKPPMDDSESVLNICLQTIKEDCSVLIFCMTKNRCENLAQSLASSFFKMGSSGNEMGAILRQQLKTEKILEVFEQLKSSPVGLDQVIKNTVSFGVAYHHAGLTFDERDIIEGGFKSGAIRVLVATSTLSSGVNLPARKVIIRSPVFQRQPINILTYKQMIGRAGRMGKDTKGESILVCTENEKKIGFELMMGVLDPVKSCIESEDKYMRAVLEMIASQVACTKQELDSYSKCTLLFKQDNTSLSQNELLENTLMELKNFELIRTQTDNDDNRYVATSLGKACLSSSMAPNDGLSLFCELQKARQCLVLETDLHLIYLVTPYSVSSQWGDIDWLHLLTLWESLTKAMKRVGELVGVQESFIIRCMRGTSKMNNVQNKINIHKRFYTALALQDLVNEVPLSDVAKKFQCARGFLQSLQQAAATFAGMVTAFSHQLGWKNMELLISQFQDRLHFGTHSELLELLKLPSLNGMRARTLFNAGFETVSSIATADVNTVENALYRAVPFQSEKERDGDDSDDVRKRNKIKNIWITGCCGMTTKEAAENLVEEARKYLENEIGVTEIKWNIGKWNRANMDVPVTEVNGTAENIGNEIHNEKDSVPFIKGERLTAQEYKTKPNTDEQIIDGSTKIDESNVLSAINKSIDLLEDCKRINENYLPNEQEIKLNVINSPDLEFKEKLKCQGTPLSLKDVSMSILKDEIVWDSMNFTEPAISTVTTHHIANKCSSPNINIAHNDPKVVSVENTTVSTTSSKSASFKDVSLFSSDGDNSSLFDDSLPIDQISSKYLDDKREPHNTKTLTAKEDTYSDINIDSNTILDAFKTSIELDDEDDMKLVYEDDNKVSESELETGFNISTGVEVIESDSQEINDSVIKRNFISPLKRSAPKDKESPRPQKKRSKTGGVSLLRKSMRLIKVMKEISVKFPASKSFNIEVAKQTNLKCFLLKTTDIADNMGMITNIREAAIYLEIKTNLLPTVSEGIGAKFLCADENIENVKNTVHSVKAISIYYEGKCICLDVASANEDIRRTLKNRLSDWFRNNITHLRMMCSKFYHLHLKKCFGIDLPSSCLDISLAEWLIESDEKIPEIMYLAKKYCDIDLGTVSLKVDNETRKLRNLDWFESLCIKSWAVWEVAENQNKFLLQQYQSVRNTLNVEIQIAKILANCEYYGLTVDKDLASRLLIDVKNSQETLQKKAYKICGYHFNLMSSRAVAKVVGIYKGRKVSTKKSVLTSHNSPIATIVMFWRKLNSILTHTLYPLTEKACIYSSGDRINPSYTMYTCTGRISMHEPNLQNVPRTFSIPVNFISECDPCDDVIEFNCRKIFRAAPGCVLVSADYCQLEMRILTHYCGDEVLTNIMSSDVDVFKSIAATWGHVDESQVDDDLRQKAKQLCYGILYGMGNRTLSQHLEVTEVEAAVFMDTFYKTYPAIKVFTQSVIEECRKKGYVETLMKRRRYLPNINSYLVFMKSAAERQAVNTTIQGSAADIAKAAMCALDNKTQSLSYQPRLILQMHDELIYEVPETQRKNFAKILKSVMEEAVKLNVLLPVKVRSGHTWGCLEEIKL